MSGTTRIVLARHGETLWNRQARLQGQKDSPLTSVGKQQARRIRDKLENVEIDAAYVSPLQRAVDTIQIILDGRPVEPVPVEGLMEIALGPWEGVRKEKTRESHAREYASFWYQPELFSLPGAETYADLQKRLVDQLKAIFDRHRGQTVLVVSHWIAIKSALAFFTSTPISRLAEMPDLDNGAFVSLVRQADEVSVEGIWE